MSKVDDIRAKLKAIVGVYGTAPAAGEAWGYVAYLLSELDATEAARVEAFEMARKFIVSDDPPSEEAMRYGREVVAPRLAADVTPAIADGTSQPWTPSADVSREAYDALAYEVASAFCEPGPHREALRQTRFPGPFANKRGVLVHCLDDAAVSAVRTVLAGVGLRYELPTYSDVLVLPRAAPAPPPAESGGILAHWLDGRDKPPADTTAVIYGLHARVSALLLERDEARKVGEEALTRATAAETERDALRADRRFELVKAALASGRDGYTAVRDADDAMGAMGKAGGANVPGPDPEYLPPQPGDRVLLEAWAARLGDGQGDAVGPREMKGLRLVADAVRSAFAGMVDGKLVAAKVYDVSQTLLRAQAHSNPGLALAHVDEARVRLLAMSSWLRGEGGEP